MAYVNTVAKQRSLDASHLLNCEWSDLQPGREGADPTSSFLNKFPALGSVRRACDEESKGDSGDNFTKLMTRITSRWSLIRALNKLLIVAMPLVDLTRADTPNTVAYNLSRCRYLVLGALKDPLWAEGLSKTVTTGDASFEASPPLRVLIDQTTQAWASLTLLLLLVVVLCPYS